MVAESVEFEVYEEKAKRIEEISFQLEYLDRILPIGSIFRQDYNALKNQPLALLSNEQLQVLGSQIADLQELVRKSKVQP